MPPDERSRQRLLRSGGDSLSDAEILAVLLGNGCREVCTLELAREILDEAGGVEGLIGIRSAALQRRGLGEAKAACILASLRLGSPSRCFGETVAAALPAHLCHPLQRFLRRPDIRQKFSRPHLLVPGSLIAADAPT
jgi:DNA repair protein RadC